MGTQLAETTERHVYKSRFVGYRLKIRSSYSDYNSRGDIIRTHPTVSAEFGEFGGSAPFEDHIDNGSSGMMHEHFEVRGGVFDLEDYAEKNGWDAELQAEAIRLLDRQCVIAPGDIERVNTTPEPAAKPWPSFDTFNEKQVIEISQTTGQVADALAYERENQARPTLIAALVKLLEPPEPENEEPDENEEPPAAVKKPAAAATKA